MFGKSVWKQLLEIEIICNIRSVFTVTFDQFNASLLNKSIHFLKAKKQKPLNTIATVSEHLALLVVKFG